MIDARREEAASQSRWQHPQPEERHGESAKPFRGAEDVLEIITQPVRCSCFGCDIAEHDETEQRESSRENRLRGLDQVGVGFCVGRAGNEDEGDKKRDAGERGRAEKRLPATGYVSKLTAALTFRHQSPSSKKLNYTLYPPLQVG